MSADPWLQRWLPLLHERAGGAPVLELGCGDGRDTFTLVAAGLDVVAVDLSPGAIATARARVPQATFHVGDLRSPFPVADGGFGIIVASLSLHYFPWKDTVTLVERIRGSLRAAGVLLCRLNSTSDHNHGAIGHPRIEHGYFLVDGTPKRFFDRSAVEALFATGWRMVSVEENAIARYAQPKVVWDVVLERLA
jgi:SAM-dependent methyltransferase